MLNKNKDNISPVKKVISFVRYGACPSCQTMMYKIKKQADNSDVRFASLRGETCGGRADEMLDKLIKIKRSNPAEHPADLKCH